MKEELLSVRNIIHDTVVMLCRNGVSYKCQLKVQGLLGVTLDDEEIFLVHFNEVLTGESNENESLDMDSSDKTVGDRQVHEVDDIKIIPNYYRIESENTFGCKPKFGHKVKNAYYSQTMTSRRKLQKRVPTTARDKYLGTAVNDRLHQKNTMDCRTMEKFRKSVNNHENKSAVVKSNIVNSGKNCSEITIYSEVPSVKTELPNDDECTNLTSSVESSVENDNFLDAPLNIKCKQHVIADCKLQESEIKRKFPLCRQILSANVSNPTFETCGNEDDVRKLKRRTSGNARDEALEQCKVFNSNEASSSSGAVHSHQESKQSSDNGTTVNDSWEDSLIDASALSNVVYSSSFDDFNYNTNQMLACDAFSANDYSIQLADPFSKTSWQEFSSGTNYKAITAVVRDCLSCGEQYACASEKLRLPPVRGLKRTSAEKMKVFRARRQALHGIVMSCGVCRERILALSRERCGATMRGVRPLDELDSAEYNNETR